MVSDFLTVYILRIVSFLPSATETLYQLGAGSQIVGVTHECTFPPQAAKKPQIIRPSFDPSGMSGHEIDAKIVELMRTGKDIYVIDDETLKHVKPDFIVAQGLCEVCSPFTKEISRAVNILNEKPDVLVLDPHNLDDILHGIMEVAERVGKVKRGQRLVSLLQVRINAVKNMKIKSRPRVLCIEWLDPLFTAGHWVPQMVEYAGGINGISSTGEPSRRMDIDEVVQLEPDIIILMPCGFDILRTLKEMSVAALGKNEKWNSLHAVKSGNVYVVNANAYFSKPGPRTIVGLEILAKILHPDASQHIRVPKKGTFEKLSLPSLL
jgi:iron complex transport system substrate-binding protein